MRKFNRIRIKEPHLEHIKNFFKTLLRLSELAAEYVLLKPMYLIASFFEKKHFKYFIELHNAPSLTDEQKEKYKKSLSRVNNSYSEVWYTTKLELIDSFGNEAQQANLHDISRLIFAAQYINAFQKPRGEPDWEGHGLDFTVIINYLEHKKFELEDKISFIESHAQLCNSQDITVQQLKIARLSAISSIASALAAISLAIITYLMHKNSL